MNDPEVVYRDKIVRVQVPDHLLAECEVSALPMPGERWTWLQILERLKQKDAEQVACNERFGIIRDWQESEP